MFNPGLIVGQEIDNSKLCEIFGCSSQGGMRRSNKTNTLVIVTDYTRGIYHDKWVGGVLHYTGMGLSGDQDINYKQNRTLNESGVNGVDVHLFEVLKPMLYTYCGRIKLVDKPYTEIQLDQNGYPRTVWMFPVRPVPDNDVIKPDLYVFKNWNEYKVRGKNVDQQYADYIANKTCDKSFKSMRGRTDLKGKRIFHKSFGIGLITKYEGKIITVKFAKEVKTLNYKICVDNNLIEFI